MFQTHSSLGSLMKTNPTSRQFLTREKTSRISRRYTSYNHPMFKLAEPNIAISSLEARETINTLRKQTATQLTKIKRKDNLLSIPSLDIKDNLKPREPKILEEFYDKFHAKTTIYRDHHKHIYESNTDNSFTESRVGLDACIENIKYMLASLEEKASEIYSGTLEDVLERAFTNSDTEIIENLLRPKLELVSGILKELETDLYKNLNPKADIINDIHLKYSEALSYVFDYIQTIDRHKLEIFQQKKKTEHQ